jgi:hypothetical protein
MVRYLQMCLPSLRRDGLLIEYRMAVGKMNIILLIVDVR